jgi:hypothetical protein
MLSHPRVRRQSPCLDDFWPGRDNDAPVTRGSFGGSLFLIALGAILRYAVTAEVAGIDIATVGLILMIAGGVMFVLTLIVTFSPRGPRDVPPPPY